MEPRARQINGHHVRRPVCHAHRAEEERHHNLQQQGQRCPPAGSLPGQTWRPTAAYRPITANRRRPGSWTEDEFVTKGGVAFRALGAGQSPRGSRNEAVRPDVLLVDDFDTDEDTKNPDTIQKRWDWWGERPLSDPLDFGADPYHFLRQHHRQGLLRGAGRKHGRPLGHREYP